MQKIEIVDYNESNDDVIVMVDGKKRVFTGTDLAPGSVHPLLRKAANRYHGRELNSPRELVGMSYTV